MSVISEAITKWGNMWRLVVLLAFASLLLWAFLCFLLPHALSRIAASGTGTTEVTLGTLSGIQVKQTVHGRTEITSLITLPASQLFVDTGMTLKPGDSLEISATGLVNTGCFFDWSKVYDYKGEHFENAYMGCERLHDLLMKGKYHPQILNDPPEPASEDLGDEALYGFLQELSKRTQDNARELLLTQHRQAYQFGWRNPEGVLACGISEELLAGDQANEPYIKGFRLLCEKRPGCLLGYLAVPEETPSRDFEENRVFVIGTARNIFFEDTGKDGIELRNRETRRLEGTIDFSSKEARLFLTVNDCVIDAQRLDKLLKHVDGNTSNSKTVGVQEVSQREKYDLPDPFRVEYELQKSFYDNEEFFRVTSGCQILDEQRWQDSLNALWFWDNEGSFSVVIKKKEKQRLFD